MDFSHIPWVCTDDSTRYHKRIKQYGRKISDQHFQFKEGDSEVVDIFLDHYNETHIEEIINSYGYTLFQNGNGKKNIKLQYGDEWEWVVAECIFETEEASFLDIEDIEDLEDDESE